jgi:hypothetical protein
MIKYQIVVCYSSVAVYDFFYLKLARISQLKIWLVFFSHKIKNKIISDSYIITDWLPYLFFILIWLE